MFDKKNISVLKAGGISDDNSKQSIDLKIEAGERLIGVKSGRRGENTNLQFDVQFIVGK